MTETDWTSIDPRYINYHPGVVEIDTGYDRTVRLLISTGDEDHDQALEAFSAWLDNAREYMDERLAESCRVALLEGASIPVLEDHMEAAYRAFSEKKGEAFDQAKVRHSITQRLQA